MRGHIRQLDDRRFQLFFDIGPDPVTGRRRQRSRTVRGTRELAEKELARILEELGTSTWADDGSIRIGDFVELWLEARRTNLRDSTRPGYRSKLRHLVEAMGHRKLGRLTGGSLTALYGRLLERGLSPATVNQLHRIVHKMAADAIRWGYLRSNPADAADPPTSTRKRRETWDAVEATKFLQALSADRWSHLWHLAIATGMRRSELCGLRWEHVNLEEGSIHVVEALHALPGGARIGDLKRASSRRRIALDSETVAILRTERRRQAEAQLARGEKWEGYVLCWPDGRHVHPDVVSKAFARHVDRLGLPDITFHDLRHTSATLALAAGVAPKVVSERLGHSGIAITLDTYTSVPTEVDRQAAEAIARLIR